MTEQSFRIDQRVKLVGRQLRARVAYVGQTDFASGKWIGVVLDEEKGRNNGTVRGVSYFKCAPNHGLFLRPSQLIPMESTESLATPLACSEVAEVAVQPEAATAQCAEQQHVTSSATNHLKMTKINQPKQAKEFLSSSSQLALHAVTAGGCAAAAAARVLAPKRSKTTVSPSESFCCAKRAAFTETGFLEILQPRYTPGRPLHSPSFSGGISTAASNREQQKSCAELENKISALLADVEELKAQRVEDKRRNQEMEKVKLQNEQLLEFKVKIMEQHGLLQRELQRSRQETREARELRDKCKRELEEVTENVELLTLDKEMAEEHLETLQMEFELAKEQVEELKLDLEILRTENEDRMSNQTNQTNHATLDLCQKEEHVPTVGEVRKLEQYNLRLKETVVRLRDLLAQEKQETIRLSKELETKYSEVAELKKTKELLSQRVDLMERQIIELKEQVDVALGAESMVESLAESKLELEERVKLLEEEVAELEALEEIHEQLIESNQELEMDLRDEIDALNNNLRTVQYEKSNALELLYDRDVTIAKFRELVKSLNEQILLKDATATITSLSDDMSSVSNGDEAAQHLPYNHVFHVTKAYGRAVDAQLSSAELKISKLHVEHLLVFMPEQFMLRGGEYDVVLVLLRLQHIAAKVEIICNAINEKFQFACDFGKDAIFEGYSVQRYAFRSRCLYWLRGLNMVLQQLIFGLNNCDYELCTHVAIYRAEVESQEKHIDDWLRMLKSDLLDEHSSTEPIERTVSFFNTLHGNFMATELVNAPQFHSALLEVLEVGVDCVHTNAGMMHSVLQVDDEQTEASCALQELMNQMGLVKQQLRKVQRKLPRDKANATPDENVPMEQLQRIQITKHYLSRLISIVSLSAKEAVRDLSATQEDFAAQGVSTLAQERLWNILCHNCVKLAPEEHQLPNELFQHTAQLLDELVREVRSFIEKAENIRSTNRNIVFMRSSSSTLQQRATAVKQQFEDSKSLQQTLTQREKEVKSYKFMAKLKENELSEMQIRKEMAERNQKKLLHSQDEAFAKISEYVEKLELHVEQKHAEIAQSMHALETKLSLLEEAYKKHKENLQANTQSASTTCLVSCNEIELLQRCLRKERIEHLRLQARTLKQSLSKFEPIFVPKTKTDYKIQTLEYELKELKKEWLLSHISIKPRESTTHKDNIQPKLHLLSRHIKETYFDNHPHRHAPSDFGLFGTTDIRGIFP